MEPLLTKTGRSNSWLHCVFKLFQQCLTLLHWDRPHQQALGHMVKLTSEVIKLMKIQPQDAPFSLTLLETFCLLAMVSNYLNLVYTPQCDFICAPPSGDHSLELDSLSIPLCQALSENHENNFFSMDFLSSLLPKSAKLSQNPDKRLTFLWKVLYREALRCQADFCQRMSINVNEREEQIHEESMIADILCHIQATLQSSGRPLHRTLHLKPVIGEECFLLGSYKECVQIWKNALQANRAQGGKRACFLQMRYLLAILYCHLHHNNLSEAQGLCDQLVKEILRQSRWRVDQIEDNSESPRTDELGLLIEVHMEAALAVVQSMARFMAAYFTNQPLYVLPPHNVNILPPLHIRQEKLPRVVPMQHSMIASVIRDQNLSSVWTVEYALDVLLIGGLIPEAIWLALQLGDWKMSVSISLAYNLFCRDTGDVAWLNKLEFHVPHELTPTHAFREKLQSFLGRPASSENLQGGQTNYKQFTDPIEEEDADILFSSVQEMLKAAVMAEADILSDTFLLLIEAAKNVSKKLCGLVPEKLYLPAPPLYCPQPATVSEDDQGDQLLKSEKEYRQKVSGVLQRILLLLRAARCSLPAAKWYIKQLKWSRKVMQKIRSKSSLPPLNAIPESLLNYSNNSSAFFKPGPGGDQLDNVSCQIIGCFRELCALCWMLHVRERLSDGCRRYQIARDNIEKPKDFEKTVQYDSSVVDQCLNALEWAYRMLPFSAFMNTEELVQDIILSLIGELPPVQKVADILVKAFPSSEVVRVPLRDKYHSLKQRLRHLMVKGHKGEEMMSVVMHDVHKVRLKTLKRVVRNIGPIEMSIWEPEEEDVPDGEAHCYDRFSLGTSLSRSTVTEFGKPQVYSDADTGDTLSEALMTEEPVPRIEIQIAEDVGNLHNTLYKKKEVTPKTKNNDKGKSSSKNELPVVGTWEFERDDDEYIAFLDLFLSYLLERDLINYTNPCIPFLTSFSEHLREHELNSLLFDIHTSLKRRQDRARSSSVFRAGCSYSVAFETDKESENLGQHYNEKGENVLHAGTNKSSLLVLPRAKLSRHNYLYGSNSIKLKTNGLFGLNIRNVLSEEANHHEDSPRPDKDLPSQSFASTESNAVVKYIYKINPPESVLPSEELTAELKKKFGSASRLLEWMIRWSDKRLLHSSNKEDSMREFSTMMRVKTSAAAILTSFLLLEERYFDVAKDKSVNFRVPDAEFIIVPVFHHEDTPKVQREMSADTGYRGSTGSPVNVLEEYQYEEARESISETSSKHEDCSNVRPIQAFRVSPIYDMETQDQEYPTYDMEEMRDTLQKAVEIESASEDEFEKDFIGTSPSISVSIRPIQRPTEKIISNVDISHGEFVSEILEEKSKNNHRKSPLSAEPTCDESTPLTQLFSKTPGVLSCPPMLAMEPSIQKRDHIAQPLHNSEPEIDCIDLPLHNSTPEREHVAQPLHSSEDERMHIAQPLHTSVAERANITGPVHNSGAVRQMFQDEMFRLLQLQQINFMSLMQVVGASFTNLPHMQQILQQSEPTLLSGIQVDNIGRGVNAERTVPTNANVAEPSVSAPHTQQTSTMNNGTGRCSIMNNSDVPELSALPGNKEDIQDPPGLQLLHNQSIGTRVIPVTQNMFGTTAPTSNLPLLNPTTSTPNITAFFPVPQKAVHTVNSFPMLHLSLEHHYKHVNMSFARPPPKPMEAWVTVKNIAHIAEHHGPRLRSDVAVQPSVNQQVKTGMQREEQGRWAERVTKGHQKQLNLAHYPVKPNDASQQQNSESVKAPILDHHVLSSSPDGLPLLHLQTASVPFFPSTVRPNSAVLSVPNQPLLRNDNGAPPQVPQLTLLHARRPLESKVIPPAFPFKPPSLIPLQNIITYEQSLRKKPQSLSAESNVGPIQLLKASIEPFEHIEPQKESTKRQKRRVEKKQIQEKTKAKPEKKTSVSFRPEDSIIADPIIQTVQADGNSTVTVDKPKERREDLKSWEPGDGFILPLGLFDDLLLEQNKKQSSVPAPAELHYMAAARRDIPEIHDASTNTDPEYLPSTVPQMLPPDLYLNLRFPKGCEKKPTLSQTSDAAQDPLGRQFINVIDIEESDLLKDLPIKWESSKIKVEKEQHTSHPVMSSAQLHHMAAMVTDATRPEGFDRTDVLSRLPLSPQEKPDFKPDSRGDTVTWNALHEHVEATPSREQSPNVLPAKLMSKEGIDSKLLEMEAQLSELQNMAENMELDFANSEMLVNTIENLGSAVDSDHEVPYSSRSVSIMEKEFFLNRVGLDDLIEEEEEEEDSKSEFIVNNSSAIQPPPFTSASSANLACSIVASTDWPKKQEVRQSFPDDRLNITGLSDIADIIGDLVRSGGMSAQELGLTAKQARGFSSVGLNNSTGCSKKMDRKKLEIREWMKKKQIERLAEHRKKLDELREQERNPFQPRKDLQRTINSNDIRNIQKQKDEKDKTLLSEHYGHRVAQAFALMNDIIASASQTPATGLNVASNTPLRSRQSFIEKHQTSPQRVYNARRSLSANSANRSNSGHNFALARSRSTPPRGSALSRGSSLLPNKITDSRIRSQSASSYHVKIKLDASLPRDRMSQITRRGILPDPRRKNLHLQVNRIQKSNFGANRAASDSQGSANERISRTHFRKPDKKAAICQTEETEPEFEERDSLSPWDIPDEINRILNSSQDAESLFREDLRPPQGLIDFDSVSESTGSILSNLDWNMIEDMVASIEDKSS